MLAHREVRPDDVPTICAFPQSAEELYFLFPKATFPLTPAQLHGIDCPEKGQGFIQAIRLPAARITAEYH